MDSRKIALPVVLASALFACEAPPGALTGPEPETPISEYGPQFARSSAPPVYQVVGGGSIVREDIDGSPREVYGFNAKLDATGKVTGQAEVHFAGTDLKMHIEVQCLVVRENEAWLSGPVTRSDRPDVEVGLVFVWRLEDNGEGPGSPSDRISNLFWREPNFHPRACMRQPEYPTYSWDNGDATIVSTGSALTLRALAGTWDATFFEYTNPSRPPQTQDLIAMGTRVRLAVARDGRFSMVWWEPGTMFENVSGTMDLVDGRLQMRVAGDGETVLPKLAAGRFGSTLWIDTDDAGADFTGDGEEDPARLFAVFRLNKKNGRLVNDLVGVWEASVFRYTKEADPSVVADLIAQGVTFTFTVHPDSRYTAVVDGDADTEEFIVEGSEFLTRNGESLSLTFRLVGDQLWLEGPTDFDFPGDPATPEPAMLELVMVR